MSPRAATPPAGRATIGAAAQLGLVAAAFFLVALLVYAPALRGPLVSDDVLYLSENPAVKTLSLANLGEILDPRSPTSAMVLNWSPVHLLLHALAWRAFGDGVLGHHVLNVLLHAGAAALFAALLRRSGATAAAAFLGGALFLLHPANVEAVAWISQLKSSSALVLSLLALLAFPRRAALATVLFALALLAKPTAVYALPVAALLVWIEPGAQADGRKRRNAFLWLAGWTLGFVAFSGLELVLFHRAGQDVHPMHPDPWVQARTIVTNGGRYLVMAATGRGLSAFHEPIPILAPFDPRFLAALAAIALVSARAILALRARRAEAAYWAWAAVSFAPVSQIFPFLYPVADRYLYFILPGLLGGAILAGQDAVAALARRAPAALGPDTAARQRALGAALCAAGAALALVFALEARQRARIWRNPALLFVDSATHYPDGVAANLLRARRDAQAGDAEGAATGLRAARARGFVYFEQIAGDPAFAPVWNDPRVQAPVREMADFWIERLQRIDRPTQPELVLLARALAMRGDRRAARDALGRALELGGPMDAVARARLAELGPAPAQDPR